MEKNRRIGLQFQAKIGRRDGNSMVAQGRPARKAIKPLAHSLDIPSLGQRAEPCPGLCEGSDYAADFFASRENGGFDVRAGKNQKMALDLEEAFQGQGGKGRAPMEPICQPAAALDSLKLGGCWRC